MYLPSHFEETRPDVLRALMRTHPLATLVTLTDAGLEANHVPLLVDGDPLPHGTLRGHVSRANGIWRDARRDVDVLAIFHGPQRYITPSWYPAKRENGRVVPTWNYAVVHAYGRLHVHDDADWLRSHVATLTDTQEASRPAPWTVGDAPDDYVEALLRGIVGLEIRLTRLLGKWKVSQNKAESDRIGLARALEAESDDAARAMATLVATRLRSDTGVPE